MAEFKKDISEEKQVEMTSPAIEAFSLATEKEEWKGLNRYQLAEKLVAKDPDLAAVIDMMASQVSECYTGIFIKPGHELEEDEKEMLDWAQDFAGKHKFRERMFTITKQLLLFGDAIYLKITGDNGIELELLPIHTMTILENRDQINNLSAQIFNPGIYILNEGTSKQKVFNAENILHFSLESEGAQVNDLKNRYTYGIWSHSPTDSLKLLALWKRVNIMDDIRWRHANVPRELHRLDASHITPEKFEGDLEERMEHAREAVKTELDDYIEGIKKKEVDKGYVTTQDVDVDYLEPRSASYQMPNELIAEIENLYAARFGMPASVMGAGRVRQYRGEVITSAYASLRAKQLARSVSGQLLDFLKDEARKLSFPEKNINKLKIIIKLVLDKDKRDVARQVSVLAETGAFTRNELREMMGYQPLGDKEGEELTKIEKPGTRARSPAHEREYAKREIEEPAPITPESKEDTLEPR